MSITSRRSNYALLASLTLVVSLASLAQEGVAGEDWALRHQDDNVRIYSRDMPGTKIDAVKIETHFDASVSAVADLLLDPSRRRDWDELCKEARWVTQPTAGDEGLQGQLYLYYDMPWPVTDRDMVMDTRISRRPDKIVIRADAAATTAIAASDAKRLTEAWYEWHIDAVDQGGSAVTATLFMDPDGPIPAWLLNYLSVTQPGKNIQTMKTLLRDTPRSP